MVMVLAVVVSHDSDDGGGDVDTVVDDNDDHGDDDIDGVFYDYPASNKLNVFFLQNNLVEAVIEEHGVY